MFRDQQVRTDDARHLIFQGRGALECDEFGGLALVQPAGDPFGLLAFHALPVEQVDRAIELQQHAPKRFNLRRQGRAERVGDRRGPPIVIGEQALWRQALTYEARLRGGIDRRRG